MKIGDSPPTTSLWGRLTCSKWDPGTTLKQPLAWIEWIKGAERDENGVDGKDVENLISVVDCKRASCRCRGQPLWCVPVPGVFGSGSCKEKAGKINYLVGLSKIFDINENDDIHPLS